MKQRNNNINNKLERNDSHENPSIKSWKRKLCCEIIRENSTQGKCL